MIETVTVRAEASFRKFKRQVILFFNTIGAKNTEISIGDID